MLNRKKTHVRSRGGGTPLRVTGMMVTARVADLGGRGRSFPKEVRAAEHFGVFWGSRGHFREKTALPVWQSQTAKLGNFFAQHLSLTQKSVQAALYISSTSLFNGGIITASQQAAFYGGSAPHIGQNVPKWGFEPGFQPIFSLLGGVLRVSGWCGAPTAAERRRKIFFTPKAYLHTSFCVQRMGGPELSFRLH